MTFTRFLMTLYQVMTCQGINDTFPSWQWLFRLPEWWWYFSWCQWWFTQMLTFYWTDDSTLLQLMIMTLYHVDENFLPCWWKHFTILMMTLYYVDDDILPWWHFTLIWHCTMLMMTLYQVMAAVYRVEALTMCYWWALRLQMTPDWQQHINQLNLDFLMTFGRSRNMLTSTFYFFSSNTKIFFSCWNAV